MKYKLFLVLFSLVAVAEASPSAGADQKTRPSSESPIYKADLTADSAVARINGEPLTVRDLETAVLRAGRQTFYHGDISRERWEELRGKILQEMILDRLLVKEARRQNIQPDLALVEERLTELDKRLGSDPEWAQKRSETLAGLRERMIENSQKNRLEEQVRAVAKPSEADVLAFYNANKTLFQEPQRDHLSMILFKVTPDSTRDQWDAALEAAKQVRAQIVDGKQPFADMARKHSKDPSAEKGGDLGYIHRGMVKDDAQAEIDKLKTGEISQPLLLLEGYALFRLDERTVSQVRPFADVRERATDLYIRQTSDKKWKDFEEKLRRESTIWIDKAAVATLNNN